MAKKVYSGTGRRKTSSARVIMTPGKGQFLVNNKPIEEYLPYETLVMDAKQPLVAVEMDGKFDIQVKVKGGGFRGQTGAIRLGVARALLDYDNDGEGNSELSFRSILKKAGFITRDARKTERKKPGLKKARRAPQFSKR